jgi:hypothetical protein
MLSFMLEEENKSVVRALHKDGTEPTSIISFVDYNWFPFCRVPDILSS